MQKILNCLVICLFISSIGTLAPADSSERPLVKRLHVPIFSKSHDLPMGIEVTDGRVVEINLAEKFCIFEQAHFIELIGQKMPFVLALCLTEQGTFEAYEAIKLTKWIAEDKENVNRAFKSPLSNYNIQFIYYFILYDLMDKFEFLCLSVPEIIHDDARNIATLERNIFNPYNMSPFLEGSISLPYLTNYHSQYFIRLINATSGYPESQRLFIETTLTLWMYLGFGDRNKALLAIEKFLLSAAKHQPSTWILLSELYEQHPFFEACDLLGAYRRAYSSGDIEALKHIQRLEYKALCSDLGIAESTPKFIAQWILWAHSSANSDVDHSEEAYPFS